MSIFNPETAEDKMAQAFGCIVCAVVLFVVLVIGVVVKLVL